MRVPTPRSADRHAAALPAEPTKRPQRTLQTALLDWYEQAARPLRIRTTREPWAVLVAEVMAQQTQISRVDAAWAVFLERFPTPHALAEASPADVLRAWSGLGYNRRAISLRLAARAIVAEHAGRVPSGITDLESLPGVGPYTSRAVAALAFGLPVAAVDTNVHRFVSRSLGRTMTASELQAAADGLVARHDPATWTHASMELGATVCRPKRPDCHVCPLQRWCASAGGGESTLRVPATSRRRAAAPRHGAAHAGPRHGAAHAGSPQRGSADEVGPAFEQTTRWLRGRIVAHLREADDGVWTPLPASMGSHGSPQIAGAIAALQREGILELHADGSVRLPSGRP
jgi:A/G-specific adenine glycosylase